MTGGYTLHRKEIEQAVLTSLTTNLLGTIGWVVYKRGGLRQLPADLVNQCPILLVKGVGVKDMEPGPGSYQLHPHYLIDVWLIERRTDGDETDETINDHADEVMSVLAWEFQSNLDPAPPGLELARLIHCDADTDNPLGEHIDTVTLRIVSAKIRLTFEAIESSQ